MKTMKNPIVGTMVHYRAPLSEETNGTRLFAAVVTRARLDGTLDLTVFPNNGTPYCRESIPYGESMAEDDPGHWTPLPEG